MLLQIFTVFFKIGMFTIGGGYAMLPIIQKEVVETKGWMTDNEFLDAISLTNSLPGPLATNSATFVGFKLKGVPGALAAVAGAALPPVMIILVIAMLFTNVVDNQYVQHVFEGVRPAVVALIVYAVIKLAKSAKIKESLNWLIALLALAAILKGLHPIFVIIGAALIGITAAKVRKERTE